MARYDNLAYYKPVKSNKKGKKFMVRVYLPKLKKDKIIHFGNSAYGDYGSKTASKEQQRRYLIRANNIKTKFGRKTNRDYTSPNYWSITYIWKGKIKGVKLPRPK
jgi:hypothetical protein